MTDYAHKEAKGALHKNKYKESDSHPDYRGGACWKGEQVEVSGWINTDKNGDKYLGLEIQEPYKKSQVNTPPQPPQDEDMPF